MVPSYLVDEVLYMTVEEDNNYYLLNKIKC